jgi:hypothetical protein
MTKGVPFKAPRAHAAWMFSRSRGEPHTWSMSMDRAGSSASWLLMTSISSEQTAYVNLNPDLCSHSAQCSWMPHPTGCNNCRCKLLAFLCMHACMHACTHNARRAECWCQTLPAARQCYVAVSNSAQLGLSAYTEGGRNIKATPEEPPPAVCHSTDQVWVAVC